MQKKLSRNVSTSSAFSKPPQASLQNRKHQSFKGARSFSLGARSTPSVPQPAVLPSGLDALPESLLLEVLRKVSSGSSNVDYALVCRRWRDVSNEAQMSVTVRKGMGVDESGLLKELSKFSSLTTLKLKESSVQHITDELLLGIATTLPRLRKLQASKGAAVQKGVNPAASTLDSLFNKLPGLTHLVLYDLFGQVHTLGDSLGLLSSLQELVLSKASIQSVSEAVSSLTHLTTLSLDCGNVQPVRALCNYGTALRRLQLTMPRVRILPLEIGNLCRLKFLDISCEQVPSLPDTMSLLAGLTDLRVSGPLMRRLPDALGELSRLRSLQLFCVRLAALPSTLSSLTKLTRLRIEMNSIDKWPDRWFKSVPKLVRVNIFFRGARCYLPLSFLGLKGIEHLGLRNAGFIDARPGPYFTKLTSFNVGHPFADTMDLSVIVGTHQGVTEVAMVDWQETSFPSFFASFTQLQRLRLGECNSLTSLSTFTHSLGCLTELFVCGASSMTSLTDSCATLTSLQSMHLQACGKLRRLPADLSPMSTLRVLTLDNMGVEELPRTVSGLKALSRLDIQRCSMLRKLPASLGLLPQLRSLTVTNMFSFASLPRGFFQMSQLRSLTICNLPSLESKAPEKWSPVNLRHFEISDCPGLHLPLAIRGSCPLLSAESIRNVEEHLVAQQGHPNRTVIERVFSSSVDALKWHFLDLL